VIVNVTEQWHNGAMPNINPVAKKWELDLADRVGRAVTARRKELGLTAMDVAQRAGALGYPITRQAVAKIENNGRGGKVDVAELIVLAGVLETSPLQLLYPDLVDGAVDVLPGMEVTSLHAVDWFGGNEILDLANLSNQRPIYAGDYLGGTVRLDRACRVGRARDLVIRLASTPDWEMGPGTEHFLRALNELGRAKADARREGLVVEDANDG
jgi:transcriptional regulator with XRE-family HTH domain